MRGQTLGECLTLLRTKLRVSLQASHNVQVRDTHVAALQQAQETLWDDYSWPHLRVERYLQPQEGQRYYDPAGCKKIDQSTGLLVAAGDVRIDNVTHMWLRDGSTWVPLSPGIRPENYNQWDSDAGEEAWPIERWQIAENDNVEFWPVPNLDGNTTTLADMVKFVGKRNLSSFTLEAHTADLDDQAIVFLAASELAPDKDKPMWANRLQRRLTNIRANFNPRRRVRVFGRSEPEGRVRRGPPTVYYRTS